MKNTTTTGAELAAAGQHALERVRSARRAGTLAADTDLDALCATWQAYRRGELGPADHGAAGEQLTELLGVLTAMVMARISRERDVRRGWLQSHRDEIAADVQLWMLERIEEYRPGEGSVAAYIAHRISWVLGDVLRAHTQGGGTMQKTWYQVRSAAFAARARLAEDGITNPAMTQLREATLEQMVSEKLERGENGQPTTREQVLAKLRKNGQLRALEQLDQLLAIGDTDAELDAPVDALGRTLGETLERPASSSAEHAALADDPEDTLSQLYRVALGDARWADPLLAARFGALGDVEGAAAIGADPDSDPTEADPDAGEKLKGRRGASIPKLSDATGRERAEIRDVLKRAPVRLASPHAQWSHLGVVRVSEAVSVDENHLAIARSAFADA